jgi:hypothetical protein
MTSFDSFTAVKALQPSTLNAVAAKLNASGFVTDEDGLGFGSNIIEHWKLKCDQLLITAGYVGGKLESIGKHFSHCGAIYVLYDTNKHDESAATKELNAAASKHS